MERLRVLLRTMLQQTTDMRQIALSLILGPDSERPQQRLDEVLRPVDEELYRVIAEHRRAPDLEEREDILSMLLLARDEPAMALQSLPGPAQPSPLCQLAEQTDELKALWQMLDAPSRSTSDSSTRLRLVMSLMLRITAL